MPKDSLSSADYTVLGLVWRDGPCTTYAAMLRMAGSPSSFYRKRASSTYAIAQKLLRRGLVEPIDEEVGARGDRLLRVTQKGRDVLRAWLSPPLPPVEVAYSNDLVRMRLNFIGALSHEEQEAFVDHALDALRTLLREHELALAEQRNVATPVTLLGLIYETRARIEWLLHVKTLLPIPSEAISES